MRKKQQLCIQITVLLICALFLCGFCIQGQSAFLPNNVSVGDGQSSLHIQAQQYSDTMRSGEMELYQDKAVLFSSFLSSAGVRQVPSKKQEAEEHLLLAVFVAAFLKLITAGYVLYALSGIYRGRQRLLQGRILNFIHNQDGKKRGFSIC